MISDKLISMWIELTETMICFEKDTGLLDTTKQTVCLLTSIVFCFSIKQQELFHVLAAYSMYNTEVGYCQGMSQIAALLLMYMSEEVRWFFIHKFANFFYMFEWRYLSLSVLCSSFVCTFWPGKYSFTWICENNTQNCHIFPVKWHISRLLIWERFEAGDIYIHPSF